MLPERDMCEIRFGTQALSWTGAVGTAPSDAQRLKKYYAFATVKAMNARPPRALMFDQCSAFSVGH